MGLAHRTKKLAQFDELLFAQTAQLGAWPAQDVCEGKDYNKPPKPDEVCCVQSGETVIVVTSTSSSLCADGVNPVTIVYTPEKCAKANSVVNLTFVRYVKAYVENPSNGQTKAQCTFPTVDDPATILDQLGGCGDAPRLIPGMPTHMCPTVICGLPGLPSCAPSAPESTFPPVIIPNDHGTRPPRSGPPSPTPTPSEPIRDDPPDRKNKTRAPTTLAPSRAPSLPPTRQPTPSPTPAPSAAPSPSPTRIPTTLAPTRAPSPSPTQPPTPSPTPAPTAVPTTLPPTNPPTWFPTYPPPTFPPTNPATPAPTTETIPSRLVCYSGGDPHVHPFIGGKYDIQHAGVFSAVSYAPKKFNLQQSIFACRPAADWSAGLTVKCNGELALGFGDDTIEFGLGPTFSVLLNGREVGALKDSLPVGPASNGVSLQIRYRMSADPVLTATHRVVGPLFSVLINVFNNLMSEYYVGITAAAAKDWYGNSPGLCGGGGRKQYEMVPDAAKAEDNAANLANGGTLVGYPCKGCKAGIGYVGAMCQCKEFLVPPEQQLFSNATKKPLPAWTTETWKYNPAEAANLKALNDKCAGYMTGTKIGEMAMAHPFLRPHALGLIEDCAADHEAGEGGGQPRFNRIAMIGNLCEFVVSLISKAVPSKDLCDISRECVAEQSLDKLPDRCAQVETSALDQK